MKFTSEIIDPFLSGAVIKLSDTERIISPSLRFAPVAGTRPYVVQDNDTILSIAAQNFNGNVSVWYIIFLINSFEDPLALPVGEIIKLPVW